MNTQANIQTVVRQGKVTRIREYIDTLAMAKASQIDS